MAKQSLKNKTVKGVGWTTTEMVLRYGVSFIVGIILARMLSPDEYGLIGILTIFITLFEVIVDSGFANALIRKHDATEVDYCTVFYTNLMLSFLMSGIMFAGAGLISDFFKRKELVSLTRAISPIIIINALAIVQRVRLTKRIDFKSQAIVTLISSVGSGVVGISMAAMNLGVWALVGQQLSNAGLTTILLWIVNSWFPRFLFSWKSFQEMWVFGWKLMAGALLNTLSSEIFSAVIGKIYTPATLGQYGRARQFGSLFSNNISNVVGKVTYPVLCSIHNDMERLKSSYRRLITTSVLPTFILMIGLCAMAKPLLLLLIGPKWADAVVFLQILCFGMMLNPLHRLNLNVVNVVGRSDLNLRINIIKNLLNIFPILAGIFMGIYWMLMTLVVKNFFCYYLNTYYSGPLLNYSIMEQIKDITPSFLIAVGTALPVYLMGFLPFNTLALFPFQILIWTILVLVTLEKTKLPEYIELRGIVMSKVMKIMFRGGFKNKA